MIIMERLSLCTCGLRCRRAFSIKSSIFHEILAYQELFCVAYSRLSDSRMTHKWKARENVSAWPSLLSFYFRVRAFAIPRTRLSRSLEQAMFCVVTLPVINVSVHENDNENEKIKTNNKSKKKKQKNSEPGAHFLAGLFAVIPRLTLSNFIRMAMVSSLESLRSPF